MKDDLHSLIDPKDFDQLKTVIFGGQAVAFIGAGLSYPVYPLWKELIKKLAEACGLPNADVNTALSGDYSHWLELADRCRSSQYETYKECLLQEFCDPVHDRDSYKSLSCLPFKNFVTINYDRMLERALYSQHGNKLKVLSYSDLPYNGASPHTLFHIHGRIVQNEPKTINSIVLGTEEYNTAYGLGSKFGSVSTFLSNIAYNDIVFFGMSMQDQFVTNIFKRFHEFRREKDSQTPRYIALREHITERTADGTERINTMKENDEARIQSEFGIQLLRYSPLNRHHTGLDVVLQNLVKLKPKPVSFSQPEEGLPW